MLEVAVEKYLMQRVEAYGGLCEKHVSPGRRGVPDRLVTWPDGVMQLVETKTNSGRLSIAQLRDHARRLAKGVIVHVLWDKAAVDMYVAANKQFTRYMRAN